ncbi:hypothetical protein T440DRAFT_176943 [Plenodomus tracheiphilus IPT5]|uniref:CFEM domain-containing protein n=1 Tax=Plenodomus tracheiphilus IPT5 TaxID=1408161 RepID=A0A6A7AYA8_9PLEO|nr:hypothetical protein T440DRAFT_176943 [Plenodomus tracheiphilus IPT5]
MLLSPWKRLCTSSALFLLTSPLKASPTVTSKPASLSESLQQNVPACAQSCVRSSLDERFPVACTAQGNVDCLCSHYSNTGESFGEVAVGCVYASCSSLDRIDLAYGICLGRKDAVMPTKTALTYTVIASSTPRPTAPSSQRSIATSTSVSTTAAQPRPTSTQSAFVDTISTLPSATASASTTPVPAATADTPPKMTPAQIAGLSVAAVAAFIMAIGLMALSVCLRRRRERKINLDGGEKGLDGRSRSLSARFSHYVSLRGQSEPHVEVPMMPPPVARRNKTQVQFGLGHSGNPGNLKTARPQQRPGVGTSNGSSNSSLPLDQIGIAISAELDGTSIAVRRPPMVASDAVQAVGDKAQSNMPFRPFSTLTQETVFEEDDPPARRRSSMLLPTPPVPIPPIRNLQPSRSPPTYEVSNRQVARKSELFLDIPIRHERPQPRRIIAKESPSTGPTGPVVPSSRPRLAPPIQMNSSKESIANTASSRNGSNDGDIIDYYFSSPQKPTPKASPAHFTCAKESPKAIQIRSKKSLSTVSRRSSRASSNNNNRDSLSSQTSFETDPNDTTPESDEDKQLASGDVNKAPLSPVAESPISNLRYPKVPRASNQLVARSPLSPSSPSLSSHILTPTKKPAPRRAIEPSTLLSKRNNALPPLLLESRPRLNSPHRDPFTSPPRAQRVHRRSASAELASTTLPGRSGERKSRVQSGSGVWGRNGDSSAEGSDGDVVRPLNVRRKAGGVLGRRVRFGCLG